jgi:hypothetical protein
VKYKVWFDERNGLIKAQILESLTKEETEQLMSLIKGELKHRGVRLGIMDLSKTEAFQQISKDVREVYKKHARELPLDKAAIIVGSPVVRMIARVVLASLGISTTTRFFKTEQEAIRWLRGDG